MVGQLYKPNDSRADAGFSLFYAGINLGALLGGYLCIAIGKGEFLSNIIAEEMRWHIAFGLASIVMVVSLINFVFTQRTLGTIGLQPGHPLAEVKQLQYPNGKNTEYMFCHWFCTHHHDHGSQDRVYRLFLCGPSGL